MERFTDKVVLVTGGNSGIGLAIAQRFVREGAQLVLVGRDLIKGEAAASKVKALGAACEFLQIDLRSEESVKDVVEQLGKLDVLVNNAGLGTRRTDTKLDDTPVIRWDRWRGSNLDATY